MGARGTREPYGREPVIEYVANALKRKGTPRVPVPSLLLIGPRGSGGTAVLKRLWADNENCPGAMISAVGEGTVAGTLGRAMQAFKEKRGLGMRPAEHFPHLLLAAKALNYQGIPDLQSFVKYLQEPIDSAVLADVIRLLLPGFAALPDPSALNDVFKRVYAVLKQHETNRFAKALGGYQTLLDEAGRYQRAQQDRPGQSPRNCDQLLVRAFLVDLRADSNRSRAMQRHTNVLLLLDDCDGETGDRLVDLVDFCRREAHEDGVSPDPLVLVAVRHHQRPVDHPTVAANETDPEKALRFLPLDARAPLPVHPVLWHRVILTPLGSQDVLTMTRTMETGSDYQDAAFVLALSGGLPTAVRDLTDLLAELEQQAVGPPGIFAAPWPTDGGPGRDGRPPSTVLDHLLDRVLDTDPARLDRLSVLASAASGLDAVAYTSAYGYLSWNEDVTDDLAWLGTRLWIEDQGTSRARLHPLITRLARQRLARDARQWDQVHENFERHYARAEGDGSPHTWWHKMATVTGPGDAALAEITDHLLAEIKTRPLQEFRRMVDRIATAPSRLAPSANAALELNRIAGTQERGDGRRTVTRRLVARWLHESVYLDPRGDLATVVAAEDGYLLNFGRDSQ